MRYNEPDTERLRKCGVVCVDKGERVLRMEEKPQNPFSTWCVPPFYIFPTDILPRIGEAIANGCATDAPGSLLAWLSGHVPVYAMEMTGRRFDVGDIAGYMQLKDSYMGIETVLLTGAAGFIGFHLAKRLLEQGYRVVGFDNLNDYYDMRLKQARLDILLHMNGFTFIKGDLADTDAVNALFSEFNPTSVVHLAAQAGVRYSITNPKAYIESNLVGFFNILEACRANTARVKHLIYASSSSVYGNQAKTPFSVDDDVSHPISLYAATKKSNELMAYSYSHLYGIPATGLRFFTVYGPYGRPDMAYFTFTQKILRGETLQIFNHGDMYRDFTYIDDIVRGIEKMLLCPPQKDDAGVRAKVYNIGNHQPERLLDFIETLERLLGCTTKKEYLPMQAGDVYQTYADIEALRADFGFAPNTPLEVGLARFVDWYKSFYDVSGCKNA